MTNKSAVAAPHKSKKSNGLGLSSARQKKGVSLQQVVEKTKICMRYLNAIEAEHFAELPGGIFALNYLRQYAEASGFDPERLVNYYSDKLQPEGIQSKDGSKPAVAPNQPRSLFERLFRAAM